MVPTKTVIDVLSEAREPLAMRVLVSRVQETTTGASAGEVKGKVLALIPDLVTLTPDLKFTLRVD